MKKRSRFHPRVRVDTANVPAVGQAGGVLLTDAVGAAGLDAALAAALASWRKPLAIHDPGKVVLDLALTLAVGGDCLADIALLRAEPGVYGRGGVGSDGLPHDRRPGRRRAGSAQGDQHGSSNLRGKKDMIL
ncbi:hypothetical protein SAMN05661080_05196 [Modestobacter sp. DSM 44400]|nr:hypothetical protein SAMN05661080_05196 [Modestobacter sp. DSM 44400]